ncbi:MAG: hypothetical protein HUJ94_03585 [Bacteroidales bacterium]|nr:hypothetical protein [Bacteroidales bacterium]
MITLGFRKPYSSLIRGLFAFAVGAILLFYPGGINQAFTVVVKIIAGLLVFTAITTVLLPVFRKLPSSGVDWANFVVDILLALILFRFADKIGPGVLTIIGILLIAAAVFLLVVMISAASFSSMGMLFLLPFIVILFSALLLFIHSFSSATLAMLAGIALMVYGTGELVLTFKMKKAKNEYEAKFRQTEQDDSANTRQSAGRPSDNAVSGSPAGDLVQDAEFEKID